MSIDINTDQWSDENEGYGPISEFTVVIAFCENHGLSRDEFAHRFGLTEEILTRWERLEHNDSDKVLMDLIDYFPGVVAQMASMARERDREFADE